MRYRHTQKGYLVLFVIAVTAVLFAIIISQGERSPWVIGLMAFILLVLASFAALTVTIDHNELRIRLGVFRKAFRLSEIASAGAVKNRWYTGWGIRLSLWPYMWIFNVSGFDAVEIRLKNGRIYRIGTDEPKRLERAISEATAHLGR